MVTTPKGVPYPASTDPNNVPLDLQRLADWVDARPGVAPLTTAQLDALAGVDLWNGRVIYNLTTLQLERYDTTGTPGWRAAVIFDHGLLTGLADDDHPQYVLHTELTAADYITTTNANAAYVAKTDPAYTAVLATETTTSTAFTDLATVGPTLTVTIGASERALVLLSAEVANGGGFVVMGYGISGASTSEAVDDRSYYTAGLTQQVHASYAEIRTNLTPGLTTFTAKYRVNAGTGTYARRGLLVIPL